MAANQHLDILIVNKDNNFGLTRDTALLIDALASIGRSECVASKNIRDRSLLDWLLGRKHAKTIIHIERAFPRWYGATTFNLLCPNQERFPRRHIGRLKAIDLVLAKSRHAEDIFRELGVPTCYIGFTSEDRLDANVEKDWSRFFHLAGGSTLKGTEDVIDLWSRHPEWPELVLVQRDPHPKAAGIANIRVVSGYIDDADLKHLQNRCGIHLCPSRSEGWGHHLVEALSVGAVTVTTDGPPMNEHVSPDCGILVPYVRTEPRHLGTNYLVDLSAMEAAIEALLVMQDAQKQALGTAARQRFLEIDAGFRKRLADALAPY
ncbi:glycosyltransferase [Peteryoungia ipomoeae]|uniref:Glycosyltransferase family 4 protein n=1 Tax=Peteryoungia ipomoeae TaxID=1210932 RepID=A0A4S8P411_9HYPH|nr:glycosyltransferase [Peteryoungia ipomoeae]THV24763.1 glycosyltransferase family 4 protein [Peteryoungia ipomoeae]